MDENEWEFLTVALLDICPKTTDALEQASQQPNYKGARFCKPTVATVSGSQSGLESAPEHSGTWDSFYVVAWDLDVWRFFLFQFALNVYSELK